MRVLLALALTLVLASPASAAWTFFGVTSSPADNGTSTATQITLTPPGSMTAGDLVFVVQWQRGTATFSIGVTGGQLWNSLTRQTNGSIISAQAHWARFDGTWAANPRFDFSAGTNTNALMMVFRPTGTSKLLAVDVAQANGTFTAGSTPFTKTITGHTRTKSSCVTITTWITADDNTWGTLSGTGWSQTSLTAQYRNTSGSDMSLSAAYNIGSGATNNVSLNQSANGGDAGLTSIISFFEYDPRRPNVVGDPE